MLPSLLLGFLFVKILHLRCKHLITRIQALPGSSVKMKTLHSITLMRYVCFSEVTLVRELGLIMVIGLSGVQFGL